MSILNAVSQASASPPVGADTKTAILAGLQSSDPQAAAQIGAASAQSLTASKLLASLTQIGQNVDLHA